MNEMEINKILSKGATQLDITPSMFEEATAHYKAVGEFLERSGVEVEISPCGSILTGTVVRPYSDNEDAYFDIDVLVKRPGLDSSSSGPGEARNPVDDTLLDSERYCDMVEECDECITVEYVLNGKEGGFRLDLNTCVDAGAGLHAQTCETRLEYADLALSMAWRNPERWHGSNPRGLCQWFLDRNERFAAVGRTKRKERILKESLGLYSSIEEVPDPLDRSEMQRAVQVLKRSRDVFYHRCRKLGMAPASCIVTVIVGSASAGLPDDATAVDFIGSFIRCSRSLAETRILRNPVYDEDLLQKWGDGDFALFSSWVEEVERSLNDLRCGTQAKCGAAAEAIFGCNVGKRAMPAALAGAVSSSVSPSKPWSL